MPRGKPPPEDSALFKQIAPRELRKGELRKLDIVRGTIASLAEVGWIGTNYESVGKRCGMQRPHVAYHYPKWDDLIEAAIRFAYGTGQAVVAEYLKQASPAKLLEAYIRGTFDWFTQYPDHRSVVTLLLHLRTFDDKYAQLYGEMTMLGEERLHACLFPEKETTAPSWHTAKMAHAMLVGRCLQYFAGTTRESVEEMTKSFCETTRKLLPASRPGRKK